jgi:hypothetical protein
VPGFDTLYVASNTALEKFSFDGTSWTARGTVSGPIFGLSGRVNGTSAVLYATSGFGADINNNLEVLTDSSAFNANITGSFTTISPAGSNFTFRGVVFVAPVPEPACLLLGLAGIGGLARIRKCFAR